MGKDRIISVETNLGRQEFNIDAFERATDGLAMLCLMMLSVKDPKIMPYWMEPKKK